ncbi:MAG TPA: permease prefix domain 1-containing protein [Bryobacteraceae bacterium]|jgi:hypothetical protein|nr:permease prefix domain 1-containing protein [Bryobacteraceae bacterium]
MKWFFRKRRRREQELNEELESHFALEIQQRVEGGEPLEEARVKASRDFGNLSRVKEVTRTMWGGNVFDALWNDLRFAGRLLRNNPSFSAIVVFTLALGIGANTAIFSIVNALLLNSLPYSHPERMGTIYTRVTGPSPSDERQHLNGEQWELLRDNVPSLISAISGIRTSGINLRAGSQVEYLHADAFRRTISMSWRSTPSSDAISRVAKIALTAQNRHPELRHVAKYLRL